MSTAQVKEVLFEEELHINESLIDTLFSENDCTPWSMVYDDLCKSVGQFYGLDDIKLLNT